ncbi:MAG: T9SS type A sorting domain-containing protein [candidate division Zixibacteria bacterium]|nr:T9SS type A sorting domain-containing protein [candidate division Zixibacteria bacterium]
MKFHSSSMLTISLNLLFVFSLSSVRASEEILIWDRAADYSQAGQQMYQILSDNNYNVEYADTLVENTSDMLIGFPGLREYDQGDYPAENQLERIRAHLSLGKDAIFFGHQNLLFLPYLSWLGFDEFTWCPLPTDSAWGVEDTFMEDLYFSYPDPRGTFAISDYDLERSFFRVDNNPGPCDSRGVYFVNGYRALTFNIDPSLIVEGDGFNTREDLILACLQGFFNLYPTDIGEIEVNVPLDLRLHRNYPNPFNSQTTILFKLADPAFVKLTIYNLLGQVIDAFPTAYFQPGENHLVWDAGNRPSGVYLYELSSVEFSEIGRMTLLK